MPPYRSVRRSGYGRVPRGGGAVRNLARGMGYAWRNRRAIVKAGRSFGTRIRNAWSSRGSVLTQQRDVSSKRPTKQKRPNKRFVNRVENVISQHAGKNTVVFQGAAGATGHTAGNQAWTTFCIFGSNGFAGFNADIIRILGLHEDATDLEAATSKNLFFDYGVLSLQFTARSTNTTPVIMDIYEYKVRKNMASYTDLGALITDMIAEEDILQDPASAAETSISLTQLGTTPYQIPSLCKNVIFGRRTTIMLDIGKTTTYTLARKKKRWLNGEKVVNRLSFAMEGWTEGILIIHRGAPVSGGISAAANVDYAYTRKYSWRAMDPDAKNEYMFEVY